MSEEVDARDRDECPKEPWVDGRGLNTPSVEVEREEADGEVEGFAGDLVAVDEGAPVSVDRNQT